MRSRRKRKDAGVTKTAHAGFLHRWPLTTAVVTLTPAASLLVEVARRSLG